MASRKQLAARLVENTIASYIYLVDLVDEYCFRALALLTIFLLNFGSYDAWHSVRRRPLMPI